MRSDSATALRLILAHEGGKVDHPKDPGGRTNRGITQRVFDAWRVQRGQPKADVWKISEKEAREIYTAQYLTPIRFDDLPPGLNYAVADFAVNSGVSRAVRELQKLVKVQKVDGALSDISGDVTEVHGLLATIATDNQAQAVAITQVATTIATMDRSTQQNAAMVEETSAAARNLTGEVERLAGHAAQFTTERRASARPDAPVGTIRDRIAA